MLSLLKPKDPDEVTVIIDDQELRYWTEVKVTLSLDTISTVELQAPWDSSRHDLREIFRPFKYKSLEVHLGGEPLFTGTVVDIAPESNADGSTVAIAGYSLPGVLGDCTMPGDSVPLEFNKQTFVQIMSTLLGPFELDSDVRIDTGAAFKKEALEVDKKPLSFLIELAKQRNFVLSSTEAGALLCWRSVTTGSPVARLENRPAGTVKAAFSSQDYFSEMTGFCPRTRKKKGSKFRERNPWLTNVLRPMAFKLQDTEPGDAPNAVRAKLGRMFANMAAVDVEDLPTWRDPKGNLFRPNTTIELHCPDMMIYEPYEFLIRHVKLKASADSQTASLNLVMPGAFSGESPESLPWDEGLSLGIGGLSIEDEVLGAL
jgi:prophage tail gpP-like protein